MYFINWSQNGKIPNKNGRWNVWQNRGTKDKVYRLSICPRILGRKREIQTTGKILLK